jgi:rubrerythrin
VTPSELREWRKRLGLTQPQLAALLGQHQNAVSRWEIAARLTDTRSAWLDREMARVEREHKRPRGRPPKQAKRRQCDRCGRFVRSESEVCPACDDSRRRPAPPVGVVC